MDIAGNFIGAQQRGVYCILKMFAVSPWKICPRRKLNSAKLESRDYRVLHTRYTASSARGISECRCRDACSRRVPTGIGYERRRPKLRYFQPIAIYMRQDIESPSVWQMVRNLYVPLHRWTVWSPCRWMTQRLTLVLLLTSQWTVRPLTLIHMPAVTLVSPRSRD